MWGSTTRTWDRGTLGSVDEILVWTSGLSQLRIKTRATVVLPCCVVLRTVLNGVLEAKGTKLGERVVRTSPCTHPRQPKLAAYTGRLCRQLQSAAVPNSQVMVGAPPGLPHI